MPADLPDLSTLELSDHLTEHQLNTPYNEHGRTLLFDILSAPNNPNGVQLENILPKVNATGLNTVVTDPSTAHSTCLFFLTLPFDDGTIPLLQHYKRNPHLIELISQEALNHPFRYPQEQAAASAAEQILEPNENLRMNASLNDYSPLFNLMRSDNPPAFIKLLSDHPALVGKITRLGLNRQTPDNSPLDIENQYPNDSALHAFMRENPTVIFDLARQCPSIVDLFDTREFCRPIAVLCLEEGEGVGFTLRASPLQHFLMNPPGQKILKNHIHLLLDAFDIMDPNRPQHELDIPLFLLTATTSLGQDTLLNNIELLDKIDQRGLFYQIRDNLTILPGSALPLYSSVFWFLCLGLSQPTQITSSLCDPKLLYYLTNNKPELFVKVPKRVLNASVISMTPRGAIPNPSAAIILLEKTGRSPCPIIYNHPHLLDHFTSRGSPCSHDCDLFIKLFLHNSGLFLLITQPLIAEKLLTAHGTDPLFYHSSRVIGLTADVFFQLLMMQHPTITSSIPANTLIAPHKDTPYNLTGSPIPCILSSLMKTNLGLAILLRDDQLILTICTAQLNTPRLYYTDVETGLTVPISSSTVIDDFQYLNLTHPYSQMVIDKLHRYGAFAQIPSEKLASLGLIRDSQLKNIHDKMRKLARKLTSKPLNNSHLKFLFQSLEHMGCLLEYPELIDKLTIQHLASIITCDNRTHSAFLALLVYPQGQIILFKYPKIIDIFEPTLFLEAQRGMTASLGDLLFNDLMISAIALCEPKFIKKIPSALLYHLPCAAIPMDDAKCGIFTLLNSSILQVSHLILLRYPTLLTNAPLETLQGRLREDVAIISPMLAMLSSNPISRIVFIKNRELLIRVLDQKILNYSPSNDGKSALFIICTHFLEQLIHIPGLMNAITAEGFNMPCSATMRDHTEVLRFSPLSALVGSPIGPAILHNHPQLFLLGRESSLDCDTTCKSNNSLCTLRDLLRKPGFISAFHGLPFSHRFFELVIKPQQKHLSIEIPPGVDEANVDDTLVCHLSGALMKNPVRIANSTTDQPYEYEHIFWHLYATGTDPMTRIQVIAPGEPADEILLPAEDIREAINTWISSQVDTPLATTGLFACTADQEHGPANTPTRI